MIDWLRGASTERTLDPAIDLGGQRLPIVLKRLHNARRLTLRLAPGTLSPGGCMKTIYECREEIERDKKKSRRKKAKNQTGNRLGSLFANQIQKGKTGE